MAFNLQTFKTRATTAVVFVAIMLSGLFLSHWSFLLLFSIIHFGCWFEYQKLIGLIDPDYRQITPFHKYGVMIVGWAIMLWMTSNSLLIGTIRVNELGWWLLLITACVLPIVEVLFANNLNLKSIGYSIAGLLYISLSWGMMMELRGQGRFLLQGSETGMSWIIPIILIASIWINDTMAYIVGSFIGRTPLSPISPKKTWEGTLGGALLCIATVSWAGHYLFQIDVYYLIIISSIAALIGTVGDLFESKLKRMAGVKDSGQIMPGHGGFLDRFDSLILATPFVWLFVQVFL